MKKKQQNLIRVIAIVLAALLVLGIAVSAITSAFAEEAAPRNRYTFTIEYLEEEQALRMSQRLVYTNVSGGYLDRVLFYVPANMFRRENALMYEGEYLHKAFDSGYVPGGIELTSVCVNGESADYGFQGADESCLRVACQLENGESCTFEFEYFLLLTENRSFLGISESGWRLSDFYFIPAGSDPFSSEFIVNGAVPFTRYIHTEAADYSADISLPEKYNIAATGEETAGDATDKMRGWHIEADNVHDFSLVIAKDAVQKEKQSAGGVSIHASARKKYTARIIKCARQAIDACEKWFGPFPFESIDIVQTDYTPGCLSTSGCIWIDEAALKGSEDDLAHALYAAIARQYFGFSAYALPSSDAWLSDSISEYIAYLILEEYEGHDAYLNRLNDHVVDSLQLTIPGGLNVTSDASLFTQYEYEVVVLNRGAAVFHELRTAMGRESLLEGFSRFYQKGLETDVLTEMDLVHALDEATGESWEAFLTDWVFNIGDYVNQDISWLD